MSVLQIRVCNRKLFFLFLNQKIFAKKYLVCIHSGFIWPFLTPNIGVIPNAKTGCIFPIFVSIFPIKLKKIFLFVFAFFNLDCVIAPLVPLQQLEQVRCLLQPNWRINNPSSFEIMQKFSDKKTIFAVVKTGCFDFLPTIGLLVV